MKKILFVSIFAMGISYAQAQESTSTGKEVKPTSNAEVKKSDADLQKTNVKKIDKSKIVKVGDRDVPKQAAGPVRQPESKTEEPKH